MPSIDDNIKLFKLTSGEEIIADVSPSDDSNQYFCNNPMVIVPIQGNHGEVGLAVVPFMLSSPKGNVILNNSAISAECTDIPEDLKRDYKEKISGIAIARTSRDVGLSGLGNMG